MTIIFKAKSQEAYCIKILAELLANNIKTACFVIDENGITLRMMDHHRTILIDLDLKAENFTIYKFNSKKIHLGINLNHLHKLIKSVKKKDTLELFIDDKNPNDLAIKVIPKENNRISTSYLKIQTVQNLKRTVQFGEEEPDEDTTDTSSEYCQDFLTEQLCRITKLSGLSNNMQIYPGKPLMFRSNVGSLGKISIYIKSKEQIESENYSTLIESDYSDD